GRKGQEALRRRFWQPEKSSGGYLASLTFSTLSTFSTLLRQPLAGCDMGLERPAVVSLRSTTGYMLPAPPAQKGSVPCAGLEAPRNTRPSPDKLSQVRL
ncbi:MAG: hypothetical protein V3T83_16530, partial [Acidobacteriota bacterium]